MNVIFVLIDSLNRHCLGPYGNDFIQTPNMDKLARRAMTFDNHFIGSAPYMPARRELMSGRKEFFWRGWGAMEPFDRHIAVEAKNAGAVTSMITDHYHYWENAAHGYFEPFDCVRMVRGHELDMWDTAPCSNLPEWVEAINEGRPGWGTRYYKNVKDFSSEKDFFSPKTFSEAGEWIDTNYNHEKFMLWVECFDVHEPFHVPEPYSTMYSDNEGKKYNCWPPYQQGYHGHNDEYWNNVSEKELEYVRSQYYGKITMTDKWLGTIMDRLDKYSLWEDTAVIVTTDHGHELGEKQRFGKQPPHYDLNARIPLMIWHPCLKQATRTSAFTTAVDLYPTILEILDSQNIASPHGRSLMPLLYGKTDIHRDAVVYGTFGCGATVTNDEFTYHCSWDPEKPLFQYSSMMLWASPDASGDKFIPDVNCPVWKMPAQSERPFPELLFDRIKDPDQTVNISQDAPDIVAQMKQILKRLMINEGVPPEQFDRLGLKEYNKK